MSNERKDDGGSAFPCQPQWWDPDDMAYKPGDWVPGLTVRDYFAAKAMQGFMARADWTDKDFAGEVGAAYRVADAMLKARQA